jgi:integrase/recombinase XerD
VLFAEAIDQFHLHITAHRGLSMNTVDAYMRDVRQFLSFSEKHDVNDARALSCQLVQKFLVFAKRECALSNRSMARKIASIKSFFAFLQEQHLLTVNLALLITPKHRQTIPYIINQQVMCAFLEQAGQVTRNALQATKHQSSMRSGRDRCIVYLLYATGMRVSEIVHLTITSVHIDQQVIRVFGKGSKERLVPITDVMTSLLEHYMNDIRPHLIQKVQRDAEYLFPVCYRKVVKPLTRQYVWRVVKQASKKIGINLSPHKLRHSMATHLLHEGVDLRSLQIILGHEHLTTTQIYTQVDKHQLRDIYDKKHTRR